VAKIKEPLILALPRQARKTGSTLPKAPSLRFSENLRTARY